MIAILFFLCIGTISCRDQKKDPTQDVLEDVNDAMKGVDKEVHKITPDTISDSEDLMIQKEINRMQDSI